LEAAESVCEADGIEKREILDLLTQLVNKSLILAERNQGQETRYRMLETIRQYAQEKLWEANEGELIRERHLTYFVDLAERAEPNLRAFDMIMWLDRLEAEHDNIRAALDWAHESDVEAQLRLTSALLWFWHIRGYKNEGIDWLERGLAIEAIERGDQPITPARAMIRGKALNASGTLRGLSGMGGNLTACFEESLALFQQVGPAGKQGMAYSLMGLPPRGKWARKNTLEQSLTLFREIGDKFGAAECLLSLATDTLPSDSLKQMAIVREEHLALRMEIGDQDGIATALAHLGDLAFMQQDYPRAIMLFEQSLAIFRQVRNKWGIDMGLSFYGAVSLWQGDYERATKIFEEALVFAQTIGDTQRIALNSSTLGVIAWFQGDYAQAIKVIENSLAKSRQVSGYWSVASSLHALGDIALALGDEEGAVQRYEAELALGQETHIDRFITFALCGLGKAAWSQGDYELAAKRFNEGLRMSQEAGPKLAMFQALYGLGRVAQSRSDVTAAHAFYSSALDVYRQPTSHSLASIWVWVSLKNYGAAVAYPLGTLAVLNIAENKIDRAARLLGSSEHSYHLIQFQYTRAERAEHDQAIAAARAALGEEAFTKAWEEGRKMTIDEAIEYALGDTEVTGG
jgi:tetratricopeptide (TPR) repeat protein